MPDPIREQITDALVTALQTVTVANGYRNTITTVDVLAMDWTNPDMTHSTLPWGGVIMGEEQAQYLPMGARKVDWNFTLVVHFELSTRTSDGLKSACEAWRTDLIRAVHADASLGVEGVSFVNVDKVETAQGSMAAIEANRGGVQLTGKVRFTELVTAA